MEFGLVWSGCWMQIGTLADSSCPRRARLSRHRPITAHTASISPCSAQNCLPVFLWVLTSIFCQYFAVQCLLPSTTLYVSGTVLLTSTLISILIEFLLAQICLLLLFTFVKTNIYVHIYRKEQSVHVIQCKEVDTVQGRAEGQWLLPGARHPSSSPLPWEGTSW